MRINSMPNCVRNIQLGLDPSYPHILSNSALEIFDFMKAHEFHCCVTTTDEITNEEVIKLCRWVNGARCKDEKTVLEPGVF